MFIFIWLKLQTVILYFSFIFKKKINLFIGIPNIKNVNVKFVTVRHLIGFENVLMRVDKNTINNILDQGSKIFLLSRPYLLYLVEILRHAYIIKIFNVLR